jgi:hypothetical protein
VLNRFATSPQTALRLTTPSPCSKVHPLLANEFGVVRNVSGNPLEQRGQRERSIVAVNPLTIKRGCVERPQEPRDLLPYRVDHGEFFSPFAFQWYAKDFYEAYKKVKGGARFSPARLTLLAQAVELAAKSLHVDQGKRDADIRKINHDLVKACDSAILGKHGIMLTENEATELKKMSDPNEAKAFEYFWFRLPGYTPEVAGVMHALTGRKDLPDESVVEGLLIKLLAPTM